ncbi:MAG: hypothetical protein FWD28_01745 [Treponema sp.]|nr:hypothetical protein [Treponema sp.]
MNNILHLEYKELLTPDYTRNYLEIKYNESNKEYIKIYIYNSEYGTIEIVNGKKEMHKWETEDEAKTGSYLNRNYPIIGLNGVSDDSRLEDLIINENLKYINKIKPSKKELEIINNAVKYIKNIDNIL